MQSTMERLSLLAVIILFSVLSASSLVPALLTKDVAMEINRSNDELLPSLRLIASMEKAIVALREEEANILLDSMSPSTASDNGNSSADRLAEAATALKPLLAATPESELLEEVMQELNKFSLIHEEIVRLANHGDVTRAAEIYVGTSTQYLADLRDSLDDMHASYVEGVESHSDETYKYVAQLRRIYLPAVFMLLSLSAVGFFLLIIAFARRSATRAS